MRYALLLMTIALIGCEKKPKGPDEIHKVMISIDQNLCTLEKNDQLLHWGNKPIITFDPITPESECYDKWTDGVPFLESYDALFPMVMRCPGRRYVHMSVKVPYVPFRNPMVFLDTFSIPKKAKTPCTHKGIKYRKYNVRSNFGLQDWAKKQTRAFSDYEDIKHLLRKNK